MESWATKQPSGTPAESHRLGLDAEIPGTDVFGNVQKYLREAIRIIRVATDISEDVGITLFWYRNEPLPTFDYKTAEQLVSEGRVEDLLRYVVSLMAGADG